MDDRERKIDSIDNINVIRQIRYLNCLKLKLQLEEKQKQKQK